MNRTYNSKSVGLLALLLTVGMLTTGDVCKADTVTWTGASNNIWSTGDATNWTGGDNTFNTLDDVIFDNTGSNTNPISISGTVNPNSVDIQSGTYSFSNGTLLLNITTAGNISYSVGAGPLGLDGATLHLRRFNADSFSTRVVDFTSPLNVSGAGGTIDLTPVAANGQMRTTYTFSGATTLSGDLIVTGASSTPTNDEVKGAGFSNLILDGAGSVNRTITNNTSNPGGPIAIGGVTGTDDTLTLTGGQFSMVAANATGTNINVQNIAVNNGSLRLNNSGNVNTDDVFATLRGLGGNVTLGNGTDLTIDRGVYQLGDFVLNGGHALSVLPSGAQNHTATLVTTGTSNLTVGPAGQFESISWRQGQNTDFEVRRASDNAITEVTVQDGGLFRNQPVNSNGDAFFNLRLLDGSRFDVQDLSSTLTAGGRLSSGGGGQILLGDGNALTEETIRITGLMNQDNKQGVFVIDHSASQVIDDGNVVLRYESNTGGANKIFNLTWDRGAFREGSAGTEFAPATDNLGIAAVGATSGTVFTATNPVSLMTSGTVGFYVGLDENFSQYSLNGGLGDVEFQDDLSGIGTIEAANATFNGGSLTPGLAAAGTLTIDGNLLLGNSTELNFDLTTPGVEGSGINDLIAVTGDLTLDGVLTLESLPVSGTYTLFTYDGNLTNNSLVLPDDFTLDLSTVGLVQVNYTAPIPEPGSCLLLTGLGLLCLARRRKAKRQS